MGYFLHIKHFSALEININYIKMQKNVKFSFFLYYLFLIENINYQTISLAYTH